MTATLFAVRRLTDGHFYTHGYPGSWNPFPRLQLYQSRSAASRQANKLAGSEVVLVTLDLSEEDNVTLTCGESRVTT